MLVYQLMFGTSMQQDYAYDELRDKGISEAQLEDSKQQGAFKKDAVKACRVGDNLTIPAKPIPEPYFVWRQKQSQPQLLPRPESRAYSSHRKLSPSRRPANPIAQAENFARDNFIPLSSIGLALTGIGSEFKLKVNNFDLLQNAADKGKFVANWKGKQVWSLKFHGNAHVPKSIVQAEKAAFNSTLKTLKLVRSVGRFSSYAGNFLSTVEGFRKNTAAGYSKVTLDVIMIGVSFMGPAGVAVSSIYFIFTGGLSLHDDDWREVFWNNYLTDPDHFMDEAFRVLDEPNRTHQRITDRGILHHLLTDV